MSKKKILCFVLAFSMAASPVMPYGAADLCQAGSKQCGEKYSPLNTNKEYGGKQQSGQPDGEFQKEAPERTRWPFGSNPVTIIDPLDTKPATSDMNPDNSKFAGDISYGVVIDSDDPPDSSSVCIEKPSGGSEDCDRPSESGSSESQEESGGTPGTVTSEKPEPTPEIGPDNADDPILPSSSPEKEPDVNTAEKPTPEIGPDNADDPILPSSSPGKEPDVNTTEKPTPEIGPDGMDDPAPPSSIPGKEPDVNTTEEPDTESSAVLCASTTEITANAKGVLSESCIKVDTDDTGGFQARTDGNGWILIGKSSLKKCAARSLSFERSGRLYLFVEPNTSLSQRIGTVTITHKNGMEQAVVTVRQDALYASLELDSLNKTAGRDGSFYNNAISVNTNNSGPYTVKTERGCDWLVIASKDTENADLGMSEITFQKDGTFYLVAKKNSGARRTTSVTVTHSYSHEEKEIMVTQLGNDDDCLVLDREAENFDGPESAVSESFHLTAGEGLAWTAFSSSSWIRITRDGRGSGYVSIEGEGPQDFYIHVLENNTYEDREGTVTVSAPGMESLQVYVSQEKNERSLESLLQDVNVYASPKTFRKNKTSRIRVDYPEGMYADDVTITCSSSKKKVAAVSRDGTIRGIRNGKSTISVRLTLESGKSKLFRLKITVGRRKVKVTKKKA